LGLLGGGLSKGPLVSIIDDDDSVGWAVAGIIGSAGFKVLVFPSAEEFIRSDQIPCTACLIVNAKLPGMSGLQLQSHLAAAGRSIPIIFITASADEGVQARARQLGAVNVLDMASGARALLKEIRVTLKLPNEEEQTNPCRPWP
jgi:FixJ family two-component response regulator